MKQTITEENLLDLLLHGTTQGLRDTTGTVHPADILDLLHKHKEHAQNVLNHLPDDILADIVEEEDDKDKYELLECFSDNKQRHTLDEMSSDEITGLMGELGEDEQVDVLKKMDSGDQEGVRRLMGFDAESAGGIVTTEFIRIYAKDTVEDILRFLQKDIDEEATYYLYVVDREDVLKGVVSLHDIVASSFGTPTMDIVNPNVKTVLYSNDREKVAHRFGKYGFILVPVADEQQHILGVIESDDIIDVIQEENTEDIHHLGGVNKEEWVDSGARESFSSHIPWLIVDLFTTALAATVVDMFEATIAQAVALATIIPIVTGMDDNAGTRALTIAVRDLSLGELTREDVVMVLLKEIGVGTLNGIVIGIVVAFEAVLIESNLIFELVAGAAIFPSMILTNLAGYLIPVILEKLHVDPALASGVFITTVTDVMEFFMFLGLATLVLPYIIWRVIHNMSG